MRLLLREMTTILVCSTANDYSFLKPHIENAAPGFDVRVWPDPDVKPEDVGVAVCWYPEHGLLARFPNLRLITSMAAGVDNTLADPELPAHVPVCRVVDENLAPGMIEYALWGTLYFHRRFDEAAQQARLRAWRTPVQKAAAETRVGVLGLGVLGLDVARALASRGYAVSGWARTEKRVSGIETFAGGDALPAFLAEQDIVICVLPLTPATKGVFGARTFAAMKRGAALVNCGRGEHVVVPDLRAALDAGQLRGAVLDVFESEPLLPDDPLWDDPRIVVTPHMASAARASVIGAQVAENARRVYAGEPLVYQVDRARGY